MRNAVERPEGSAFVDAADPAQRISWVEYDALADALAARLVGLGLARDAPVGVLVPGGPIAHVVFVRRVRGEPAMMKRNEPTRPAGAGDEATRINAR